MKRKLTSEIVCFLLIFLWVYASLSKLLDYNQSSFEMSRQVFSTLTSQILTWAIPLAELITAGLLIIPHTRKIGLFVSLFLLAAFSVYILLILGNRFGHIPCSCGGVINKLSWGQHLFFNLIFLLLTFMALFQYLKPNYEKRRI